MKRLIQAFLLLALSFIIANEKALSAPKSSFQSDTGYFVSRGSHYFALLKWTVTQDATFLDTAVLGRLEKGKIKAAAAFISSTVGDYQIWTRIQKTPTGILGVSSTFRPNYRISVQGSRPNRVLTLTAVDPQDGSMSCPSLSLEESSTHWGRDWISYQDLDQDFRDFKEEETRRCLTFDYAHGTLEGDGITYSFRELSETSGLFAVRRPQFDPAKAGAQVFERDPVDSLAVALFRRGSLGGKHYALLRIRIGTGEDSESRCLSPASLYEGKK